MSAEIWNWLDRTVTGKGTVQDFEEGMALLEKVMSNPFYLANIRRKGPEKGIETLRYELGKKAGTRENGAGSRNEGATVRGDDGTKKTGDGRRETGKESREQEAESKEAKAEEKEKAGEEKKKVVIREEFPFLGQKDCPEEFKLMVNDMITAHAHYVNGHDVLYHAASKDETACLEAAREVVENYLNNRWIWDELLHFKRTGMILGKHETFAKRMRTREIEKMEAVELMRMYRNLPRSIQYYKDLIRDDADSEKHKERQEKMEWFRFELELVKRLMGIKEEKAKAKKKKKITRTLRTKARAKTNCTN